MSSNVAQFRTDSVALSMSNNVAQFLGSSATQCRILCVLVEEEVVEGEGLVEVVVEVEVLESEEAVVDLVEVEVMGVARDGRDHMGQGEGEMDSEDHLVGVVLEEVPVEALEDQVVEVVDADKFQDNNVAQCKTGNVGRFPGSSAGMFLDSNVRVFQDSSAGVFLNSSAEVFLSKSVPSSVVPYPGAKSALKRRANFYFLHRP